LLGGLDESSAAIGCSDVVSIGGIAGWLVGDDLGWFINWSEEPEARAFPATGRAGCIDGDGAEPGANSPSVIDSVDGSDDEHGDILEKIIEFGIARHMGQNHGGDPTAVFFPDGIDLVGGDGRRALLGIGRVIGW
jgi:hypothetical protein